MSENRDMFWQLLEPEYHGAMMFCRKLMHDRDGGDDLYQDCLLIAYTKFADLREEGAFRPWLYRIIVNSFTSRKRRKLYKRFVPLTPEIEISYPGENPTDVLQARRWIQQAFKVLSAEDQALVTLHELEGWAVADLAGLRRCSEGAVKARLFRARRKMRKLLTEGRNAEQVKTEPAKGDTACAAAKLESE